MAGPMQAFSLAILLALTVGLCRQSVQATGIKYNTTGSRQEGKLNVHIVCHTHDDSGWLKTVDQYYYGARQDIQVAGVQYILDTVVAGLLANPDRKFVYAEMSFFTRWWEEQTAEMQDTVRELVAQGRLDFINGGWVQHDEAAAHYVAMIDQTTRGHRFLKETFNKVPRVGWQIDPFGHSSTQASLMAAKVGFDGMFFGRADYQDMDRRKGTQEMELVWRGARSYGECADVFTGNFLSGNYGPPPGFWWEWGGADPVMQDDPRLEGYNVPQRVDDLAAAAQAYFNQTRGSDIMFTMGSDFHYSNAHVWFKNLDKLIHYANLDGRLNLFYSTPAEYVAAKAAYNASWPLKTDDFFPYADCPNCVWTGYFVSRPASKGYIRAATSYLQAARQLEALARVHGVLPDQAGGTGGTAAAPAGSTDTLEEAVSLTQHHDSITGTEKQHVANDYHRRIALGWEEAERVVNTALAGLLRRGRRDSQSPAVPAEGAGAATASSRRLMAPVEPAGMEKQEQALDGGAHMLTADELQQCRLANASICAASVLPSSRGVGLRVIAYNPLAWPRRQGLRLPLSSASTCNWLVTDSQGAQLAAQLLPVSDATKDLQAAMAAAGATPAGDLAADAELAFQADLPALGYAVFTVKAAPAPAPPPSRATPDAAGQLGAGCAALASAEVAVTHLYNATDVQAPDAAGVAQAAGHGVAWHEAEVVVDNGALRLNISRATGKVTALANYAGGVEAALDVDFVTYFGGAATAGGVWGTPSGAYIFRPDGLYQETNPVATSVVAGPVLTEVRQRFSPWTAATLRLWRGAEAVELEWTVGPIPFEDGKGREVALRLSSGLQSGDTLWTDANGREMQERVRNWRPTWDLQVTQPVAGNYYPITAAAALRDESAGQELALLTDRAQGAASLASGQMEVMVHRRLLLDDWRGVGESLNETMCDCRDCLCAGLVVRGTQYLSLQPAATGARARRTLQQLLNDPPLLVYAPAPAAPAVPSSLPPAAPLQSWTALAQAGGAAQAAGLPANVHLLTLQVVQGGAVLLRLAHLYEEGEDPQLAAPAEVDLGTLLAGLALANATELSLSTNQRAADMARLHFAAGAPIGPSSCRNATAGRAPMRSGGGGSADGEGVGGGEAGSAYCGARQGPVECVGEAACGAGGDARVKLLPMEIRTFLLTPA